MKESTENLIKQLIETQGEGDSLYIGGIPKGKVIESVKTEIIQWIRRQLELEKIYSLEDLEASAYAATEEIENELNNK